MNQTKKMMNVTMLISLAILFHLVESMVPLPLPVPGFKLGLANIVGLVALYLYGIKEMTYVNVMRVILASLLRGTIFGTPFYLSLGGIILSSIAAYILMKKTPLSIYGVSVGAAVFHCIGQVIVVTFIYSQFLMAAILPILLLLSIPTGIITGYLAQEVLRRVRV